MSHTNVSKLAFPNHHCSSPFHVLQLLDILRIFRPMFYVFLVSSEFSTTHYALWVLRWQYYCREISGNPYVAMAMAPVLILSPHLCLY